MSKKIAPAVADCGDVELAKVQLSRRRFVQHSAGTLLAAGAVHPLLPSPARAATDSTVSQQTVDMPPQTVDMLPRYQRAQVLEQGAYTKKLAFNTTLYPHWIGQSDHFWYLRDLPDGRGEYRLVDAGRKSNRPAFDHRALARALASASGQKVQAHGLPLTDVRISLAPRTVTFTAFAETWVYREREKRCHKQQAPAGAWKVSPDGKKALLLRDYNLWVLDLATGRERPLTQDGKQFYAYGDSPTVYGRKEAPLVDAVWSPDSKQVLTQLIDTRDVEVGMPLVQHVPKDGSLRPTILHPQRRVALPGDTADETWQFLAIDVDTGHMTRADFRACPVNYPPYAGFFGAGRGWWDADSRHTYLIYVENESRSTSLVRWDSHTGAATVLIHEATERSFNPIPISHIKTPILPLPQSNELIWYSERGGWAHLYLYDLRSGRLKNPITGGNWVVRNVLHFDAGRRELIIQTAGRIKGRNPYYCDICRVNIDSGELTEVLSTDHEYVVMDQASRMAARDFDARGVSPSGRYVVTTRSRVDQAPVSLLLDRNDREQLKLETADLSNLPKNWRWPEPVMLKTADGASDLYGIVFRPSDFDPAKSYPVLDCTYAYSAPVGAFTNNLTGNGHYFSVAAYAELGFIAVMFNNRGNRANGLRGAAYSSYDNPDLPAYNKEDCVAGIRQLAKGYPYMDLNRVGVTDFGSVPASLTGVLVYPDFYKVGVSFNANADARLFAGMETGVTGHPVYEQLAGNLRGKLLLAHGMLDDVQPVSMLFRVVEALQKANKTFDMLLLPNVGHNPDSYVIRRAWDYLVTHLLGAEPPGDFKLTSGLDSMLAEREKK